MSIRSSAVDGSGDNRRRGAGPKSVGESDISSRSGLRSRNSLVGYTSTERSWYNSDGGGKDSGAVVVASLGMENIEMVVAGFSNSRQSGHEGKRDLVEQHNRESMRWTFPRLVDVSKRNQEVAGSSSWGKECQRNQFAWSASENERQRVGKECKDALLENETKEVHDRQAGDLNKRGKKGGRTGRMVVG